MAKRRLKAAEIDANGEGDNVLTVAENLNIAEEESSESESESSALSDSGEESDSDSQLEFSDQGSNFCTVIDKFVLRKFKQWFNFPHCCVPFSWVFIL